MAWCPCVFGSTAFRPLPCFPSAPLGFFFVLVVHSIVSRTVFIFRSSALLLCGTQSACILQKVKQETEQSAAIKSELMLAMESLGKNRVEIADFIGVSASLVSAILNDKKPATEALRLKLEEAKRKSAAVPALGTATNGAQTKPVAELLPDGRWVFYTPEAVASFATGHPRADAAALAALKASAGGVTALRQTPLADASTAPAPAPSPGVPPPSGVPLPPPIGVRASP